MQALTEEQTNAVAIEGNRCCLIAGAGSGKTYTLVSRIVLDSQRTAPETMVVVTFTNAAADELKDRLAGHDLPPERFRHIGTLHSWAWKEQAAGAPQRIATERQIRDMADQVKKRLGAMARNMTGAEIWSHAVNPPAFGNGRAVGHSMRNALRVANLTHHDLVLAEFCAMAEAGTIATPGRIYVDEYQDSAPTDGRIYSALGLQGAKTYFIGDPRQAIYGFRGASPTNLKVAWDLADARATLTRNFRSGATICSVANAIARRMPAGDYPTDLVAVPSEPGTISIRCEWNQQAEMSAAAAWVARMSNQPGSIAILCRYNSQATEMARILRGNPDLAVTCSADPIREDGSESIEESIAKIQNHYLTDPAAYPQGIYRTGQARSWWAVTMTRLGIPLTNQDTLLPALRLPMDSDAIRGLGPPQAPLGGKVTVATIHAAKGLEWNAVWILGADSQAFRDDDPEAGRIAYVAATRARQHLVISHGQSRLQPESGKLLSNLTLTPWLTR